MIWIIYSLLSALFFSVKDTFSKKIMRNHVSPLQILLVESLTAFALIYIIFSSKISIAINNTWDLYLLKAILLLLSSAIFLSLLKKYEVSLIAPLYNITPAFLIIISYFTLSEKLSLINLLGVTTIVISTLFLEVIINHHHMNNPKKHFLNKISKNGYTVLSKVFIFCLFISIVAITDKIIFQKGASVFNNMFFTYLFIFVLLLIHFIIKKEVFSTIKTIYTNPKVLINGLLTNISTFFVLAAIAIPTAQVSLVIPLKRTSTLMSAFMGGIIFHEKHIKLKMVAILFMIIGVFMIVIK